MIIDTGIAISLEHLQCVNLVSQKSRSTLDQDPDPLLRKGESEDPDPDPLFPNVDPRILIHVKMRWIRCYNVSKYMLDDALKVSAILR